MAYFKYFIGFVLLVALLAWRFYGFFHDTRPLTNGSILNMEVALQMEPVFSNKGQQFSVKTPANQTIHITTDAFPRFHYGQILEISGKVKESKLPGARKLLAVYFPKVILKSENKNLLSTVTNSIREKSRQVFSISLPPTSASLLMGIIFGSKEQFPKGFFEDLQATGVLHVIAASGMNVAFVAAALFYSLGTILKRQLAIILGAIGIIFYLLLVGFEPSILRASIMALLACISSLLGRQHFAAYAVLTSGYLMLFWQPGFLFDLGFQLSFMATLGIIFVKPILDLKNPNKLQVFYETITTTLAAQIATIPLLIGVFGKIGIFALLVNALVLWIVPIVMFLGSIGAFMAFISQPIAHILLLLCLPFLLYFEMVVSFFGQKVGILEIQSLPWPVFTGYYLLLIATILHTKPIVSPRSLDENLAIEKY